VEAAEATPDVENLIVLEVDIHHCLERALDWGEGDRERLL
jgi:hypothetical protein